MEMERDKEGKAICLQLAMLDRMMKLHEWATFGDKESEELDKSASQIEAESCHPPNTKSKKRTAR